MSGYWLLDANGGIYAQPADRRHGSLPSGRRLLAGRLRRGIFTFGHAAYHGSTGALHLNAPIIVMASTPFDGSGYRLGGLDGGIFALGDAGFAGSAGGGPLRAPIVGITAEPGVLAELAVLSRSTAAHGKGGYRTPFRFSPFYALQQWELKTARA